MRVALPSIAVAVACLLAASCALAQEPRSLRGLDVYPAEYFADTGPATAYDMVLRLPGFTLVDADAEIRGYAAALGNVLVDGVRPASKREGLEQVLRRIPAGSVERIELIRSGVAGVDMVGHAVLANVVRHSARSSESSSELGVALADDGWEAASAQFEYGRHEEPHGAEFSFTALPELDEDTGRGRILARTPQGELLEDSATDTRQVNELLAGTASWRRPLGGGDMRLDAAVRDTGERESVEVLRRAPDEGFERIVDSEDLQEAEIAARYERALDARSTLAVVASHQHGWLDVLARADEDGERERFEESSTGSESIARLDYSQEHSPRVSLLAALELALNRLDSDAQLSLDGVPQELPGSDVDIEERRWEGSVGMKWRPEEDLRLEAGLRVEGSDIEQAGDSPLRRDFLYLKPSFSVAWERYPRDQFGFSISRETGQLDFADFVASASLATDVVSAGNSRLEPDKTWRTALSWERRFWEQGAVVLTYSHDEISDVIDRVPFAGDDGEVFDAPGNIGDGTRDSLELELGTPLDAVGMADFRLDASILWQHSRVTDPTTGERRGISEELPLEGSIGLEHTSGNGRTSWGMDVDLAERESSYRFDEVATERAALSWTLFLERRLDPHWRLRAELTDVFGRDLSEHRSSYEGMRTDAMPAELEDRSHRTPGMLLLTLRRSTGG